MSMFKKPSKSKKSDKIRIEVNDFGFFENVKELSEIKIELATLTDRETELLKPLKEKAIDMWVDEYKNTLCNPKSISLFQSNLNEDNDTEIAEFTITPSDKYITIDKTIGDKLISKYGDDVVTESTEYTFNNEVLIKYKDLISDLIMNCAEITDIDKENLIEAKTKYSITKGLIDKFGNFEDIKEVVEDIKPVFSAKDFKVTKV